MSQPPEIEALTKVLLALPGVDCVEAVHTSLEEFDISHIGLVDYADLPHAVLLRTNGGLPGEALGQIFFWLRPELASWRTLEFLSWQVRDWSRSGKRVQIRSRGLPPFISGEVQLGTSLAFVLEFFVDGLEDDPRRLLDSMEAFAKDVVHSLSLYRLKWSDGVVLRE